MPTVLIGWPGLTILLLAAALTLLLDLLRERQHSVPVSVRTTLIVSIIVLVLTGAAITVVRFDTVTGGLFT